MSAPTLEPPYPAIVFIHVPRTGGTTLHRMLNTHYRGSTVHIASLGQLHKFQALPEAERARCRFVHAHIGFDLERVFGPPYQYITFLREPVSRVVSTYHYIRKTPEHTHHQTVAGQNMSLLDYIGSGVSTSNIDNGMTRLLSGEPQNANAIPFGKCTRAMLAAAKRNLQERIAVVGLTEQFDASLVLMRRRFGWSSPLYSLKNTTANGNPLKPLSSAEEKAIRAHNELDLELYGYARIVFIKQMVRALPFFPLQVRHFRNKNIAYQNDSATYRRMLQFEYKRIARWMDLK